ncbi:transglycosylase family protein [Staphylococcus debuckii]|uniref:transglycosylase family protein n=1 Tax=Staphylococcus debuckii TaxID=2044912 RepID=UPI000F42FC6A|nr:transglycosylase family protein [Staphylococcus debuckii]AYU55719.1 transglycosylase [Staphylococcus debuckii]
MKKLLVTSSVAAAAFLATGVASHNADAAELNTAEQTKLAETALNNPAKLNQHPVQEGAYEFNFEYKGYDFHFESNGTYWEWSYAAAGTVQQPTHVTTSQAAPAQQQAAPVAKQQTQSYSYNMQSQSYNNNSNYSYNTQSTSYSAPAQSYSGGSSNIPAALQAIVYRESRGDIHAVNPDSGAAGKYQFLQTTWDAVAPAGWKGVNPASDPEYIQDQAALTLWDNGNGAGHWAY